MLCIKETYSMDFLSKFILKYGIHQKSAQVIAVESNEFSQGKLTCVISIRTKKQNIASTPAGALGPTQPLPVPAKSTQQQLMAVATGLKKGGRGLWQETWTGVGFPGGTSGKEPACQCRRLKRRGFSSWVGKIPWRRAWQPTPVFLPGDSHG